MQHKKKLNRGKSSSGKKMLAIDFLESSDYEVSLDYSDVNLNISLEVNASDDGNCGMGDGYYVQNEGIEDDWSTIHQLEVKQIFLCVSREQKQNKKPKASRLATNKVPYRCTIREHNIFSSFNLHSFYKRRHLRSCISNGRLEDDFRIPILQSFLGFRKCDLCNSKLL